MCVYCGNTGTAAMNGAPPTMLSPTITSFPVPQANGQPEVYNGVPQYPGRYTQQLFH